MALARSQLGESRFQALAALQMALMATTQRQEKEAATRSLLRRARGASLAAARVLVEAQDLHSLVATKYTALARSTAGELVEAHRRLQDALAFITEDWRGTRGGRVPKVWKKPLRPAFARLVRSHCPWAKDVGTPTWAYFAIGAGIEPPPKSKSDWDKVRTSWRDAIGTPG
jgi:hypothetical protein